MQNFNALVTIGFIALVAVSKGAFSIVSGGYLAGYSQDIWLFWYLSLLSTFGILLTVIVISAISVLKDEQNSSCW